MVWLSVCLSLSVCVCLCVSKRLTMLFGVTQLDAAWMAASAGVSVVIASGKAKDGVLQVTAGVTLSDLSANRLFILPSVHAPGYGCLCAILSVSASVCLFLTLSSVGPFVSPSVCMCCFALSVKGRSVLKAACTLQVKMDYNVALCFFEDPELVSWQ